MKIGIYNYYEEYNFNNALFNSASYKIGENLEYPFVLLKNELLKLKYTLDTLDIYPIEEYEKIIFLDLPNISKISLENLYKTKDLYLILFEAETIKPENYNVENHKFFKKIFTWNDKLVDNIKYFKINFSHKFPSEVVTKDMDKKFFCTMIAGNKVVLNKQELYSERVKAIKWFEKNHLDEFDLYGIGWEKRLFKRPFGRLNKFKFFTNRPYKSYKGKVLSKKEVLSNYKFSICYENIDGIEGYITEKIFDCFFAGCIPIYLGAKNIEKHIPSNTFIDKRNYSTYEELYCYLKKMTNEDIKKYISNINNFLNSKDSYQFSAKYFSGKIIEEILKGD